MKKSMLKITSSLIAALLLLSAWGCGNFPQSGAQSGHSGNISRLQTPEIAVDPDGLAVWGEVEGALYYAYVIDQGPEKFTPDCSLQLSEGQTLKVRAVSGKEGFDDSEYSAPHTYRKGAVDYDHDHTDFNSDGRCDICTESVMAELTLLAVNDLHGKFADTDDQPGVDEFTTYIKNLYDDPARAEVLLSSGDMWQGTVESSANKGKLMTEWMNEVGFVSMTLGNHEYDWGADVLKPNSEMANFPFLAINVTYNGQAVDYCSPSVVVERGGIKIGVIGAIGDCLSSISGEFSEGLSFATGSQLTQLVKSEATRLRNDGCDFIVYSIHDGGSGFSSSGVNSVTNSDLQYYDTSLSNGYIDLVFEAHTHRRYILKDEYGVYHMQGGGENEAISVAQVSFNTVSGKYSVSPKIVSDAVYASASLEDDPSVDDIFNKYFPDENPYTEVIGKNASNRSSDVICERIARLYYEYGVKEWGDTYGNIVLGGGFLKARSPYNLYAGDVTYADLFSILPFDNEIVLGRIRGADLKNKFLSGNNESYHIYPSSASVSDNSYYYIVVDSYTSSYRKNNITEIARLGSGIYARDLLAEFISEGGWA